MCYWWLFDYKGFDKKKDMLSELDLSGRHVEQSVCVFTQKYNAVL